MEVDSIVGFL